MASLRGISLNVNGIQSQPKWRAIFTMLRDGGYDFAFLRLFAFLQEPHCTSGIESLWRAEWEGSAYFSNGRSNARGVMTLLPRTSDIKVIQTVKDQDGRLLILQIEKDEVSYSLAKIYAPTQEQVQEQINLIDLLEQNVSNLNPQIIILGGDFNLCMDINLDKAKPRTGTLQGIDARYPSRIGAMMEELHLFDAWRRLNPTTRKYSFRRGLLASRLDYWIVSEHMFYSGTCSDIVPYPLSDHSSITIRVGDSPPPEAQGYGGWITTSYIRIPSEKPQNSFSRKRLTTTTSPLLVPTGTGSSFGSNLQP